MNRPLLALVGILFTISILSCASKPVKPESTALECPPQKAEKASAKLPPYPQAPAKEGVIEEINGYKIRDPYRWMEKEGEADEWVNSQNKYTEEYFASLKFPDLEQKVRNVFNIGTVADARIVKDRVFYRKREGEDVEQAILAVLLDGKEKTLVDPNEIDKEGKTAIDWFYPSKDGKLVAYGLSKDGDERSTLYIMNVETGEKLRDTIHETRACSIAWLPDSSGFFYTRYPKDDSYNRKAYFHKLGDDPANDPLIFGDKRAKTDWTSLKLSEEGDKLLIVENKGWADADLYLYDVKKKTSKSLFKDLGAILRGIEMKGGKIYTVTNKEAPNSRLVEINPAQPAPKNWKTIVKESETPIEYFQLVGDKFIVQKIENVSSKLLIYDLKGSVKGEIKLPAVGMVESFDAQEDGKTIFIFNSFFIPMTLYTTTIAGETHESEKLVSVKYELNPEEYEIKQIKYPSYDGTMVNMFIVHKKGIKLEGDNPTLLYGYGGFLVNMTPYFSRRVLFWIDRGGVYAVANIRGGGEHGEKWHQEGMKSKKFQTFRDFEYAARYLIQEKYASPKRLVLEGGSNGGLLMGAMVTQVPQLFSLAVASVGLFDMVRYHSFPPGELWVSEYGNADLPSDTGYILGYSPYHQIIKGVEYPAFYADTAESDTRVHWVHSAKFIAALQEANASQNPILFYLERKAGHGAGKGKSDVINEYINKFKLMLHIVGDPQSK